MMTRNLGIIQPGRLGDIIICLPIAKWYFDHGYKVTWPIHKALLKNFIGYIDYVDFIGISTLDCNEARKVCLSNCNTILDLSITLPGSNLVNDRFFLANKDRMTFDEMKYLFANVPFAEKWNLKFDRNIESEQDLERKCLRDFETFSLVHYRGSSESFSYKQPPNESVIFVDELSTSIFDWCSLISKANKIVAIDSSFANLVEQLGYAGPKFLVRRSADIRPCYRDWEMIEGIRPKLSSRHRIKELLGKIKRLVL